MIWIHDPVTFTFRDVLFWSGLCVRCRACPGHKAGIHPAWEEMRHILTARVLLQFRFGNAHTGCFLVGGKKPEY